MEHNDISIQVPYDDHPWEKAAGSSARRLGSASSASSASSLVILVRVARCDTTRAERVQIGVLLPKALAVRARSKLARE